MRNLEKIIVSSSSGSNNANCNSNVERCGLRNGCGISSDQINCRLNISNSLKAISSTCDNSSNSSNNNSNNNNNNNSNSNNNNNSNSNSSNNSNSNSNNSNSSGSLRAGD